MSDNDPVSAAALRLAPIRDEIQRLIDRAIFEVGGSGGRRECRYCLRNSFAGQIEHHDGCLVMTLQGTLPLLAALARAEQTIREPQEKDLARVEPLVDCVATAGSTAEQSPGAVTAAERPEPLCDWFSAKRAIQAGISAAHSEAARCEQAGRNTSDALLLLSAEGWRVSAAVMEAFVRQHENRSSRARPATGAPETSTETKEQPLMERAFRAGYHCRWHKDQGLYCFDPAMSPGDPDGAYAAWRLFEETGEVSESKDTKCKLRMLFRRIGFDSTSRD